MSRRQPLKKVLGPRYLNGSSLINRTACPEGDQAALIQYISPGILIPKGECEEQQKDLKQKS